MTVRGVWVHVTEIAPVVAPVRSPVSATGCEADAVAGTASLEPYVKTSLAVSTGPCGRRGHGDVDGAALNDDAASAHT